MKVSPDRATTTTWSDRLSIMGLRARSSRGRREDRFCSLAEDVCGVGQRHLNSILRQIFSEKEVSFATELPPTLQLARSRRWGKFGKLGRGGRVQKCAGRFPERRRARICRRTS